MPRDFQVQYSLNNVAISDAGEQSAPMTLPATPHNLALVGHSWRPDRLVKPLTELDVYVVGGGLHRPCHMGIHSVSPGEGIGCTLYLDSGGMYSRMGSTRLNWFGWPEVKCPDYDSKTPVDRVEWLIKELEDEFFHPTNTRDWCVCALRTTQDITWVYGEGLAILPGWNLSPRRQRGEGVEHSTKLILNDYLKYCGMDYEEIWPNRKIGYLEEFNRLAFSYFPYKQDGVNIEVGDGFGMTAFLRVRYILDYLFDYYGYAFDHAGLAASLPNYDKMCVANNVADAIYAGVLKYKQLLPDVTVKEFLDEVQKLAGGVFTFDEARREARFRTYDELLTSLPDADLTPYVCGEAVLGETEFADVEVTDRNAGSTSGGASSGENRINIEIGIAQQRYVNDGWWLVDEPPTTPNEFNHDTLDPPEDPPGTAPAGMTYLYQWTASFERRLPEVEGITLLNSKLEMPEQGAGDSGTGQESTAKEDGKDDSGGEVTFLCARQYGFYGEWLAVGREPDTQEEGLFQCKIHYTASDRLFPDAEYVAMTDLEVVQAKYKTYAAWRKHSNIPITVEACIPAHVLFGLDLHTPKSLGGQPVLIESIETTTSPDGQEPVQTLHLRTLRKYEDN